MPGKNSSTYSWIMEDRNIKLSPSDIISLGTFISRGSALGAGTMARPLSLPKASLPSRVKIKFKLLFTKRGNG